jgi:RimJ/RimL family protein N-acetyltransferase
MKENTASIKVLEKIGMHFWMEGDCAEHPALIYRMDKTEWISGQPFIIS